MGEWKRVTKSDPPIGATVLVAFHGHCKNRTKEVYRQHNRMQWGDWDYINSHDGEPKWWMELPVPPDDIAGPDCGCDGCTEKYYSPDSPDYIPDSGEVNETARR